MRKVIGILGAVVVVAVVAAIIVANVTQSAKPTADKPSLITMDESARAMQQAGTLMQSHGQAMRDDGQRTGNQSLIAHGDHWLRDGLTLIQGGQLMANTNPVPPSTLHPASGDSGVTAGDLVELNRAAQAMVIDPKASSVNPDTVRWVGLAMRGEGQTMIEHARVMTEEIDVMIAQNMLAGPDGDALRQAAQTLRDVGGRVTQNGQAMVDYADRLNRSLGK